MPPPARDPPADLAEALAARAAALQQRLATLARAVASVEDELAATFDRLAENRPKRADELHALAAAARQHAESEREVARRHGG